MQYIKISLLSILIFLFGISTIIFLNVGNSQNYQKNLTDPENSLSSVDSSNEVDEEEINKPGSLEPLDINVVFGDDFFSNKPGIGGRVTVNASWVRNIDKFGQFWTDLNLSIKLFESTEDEENEKIWTETGLFENSIRISFLYDTDELSFTQENGNEKGGYWRFQDGDEVTFSATIDDKEDKIIDKYQKNPAWNVGDDPTNQYLNEGDSGFNPELFINNTFSFEENHEYRFEIYIYSFLSDDNYSDTRQDITFTTPSRTWLDSTWSDPVNFVLYVIILAEVIASISFFTILWINLKKN